MDLTERKEQRQAEVIELKHDLNTKLADQRREMKKLLREADNCSLAKIMMKKKKKKANDQM